MGQEIINIGQFPNDGTGDPVRVAFNKCNLNFTELFVGDYFLHTNNPHAFGTLTVTNMLGGNSWTVVPGDPGSQGITVSASGPDNDIHMYYVPKGAGVNAFYCRGAQQVLIGGPAGATRVISMAGSVSGNPIINVIGGGGSIQIPDLVMTGNPTCPTAPAADNDTTVANTAWVVAYALANVGLLAGNNLWTGNNFFNGQNTVVGHTAAIDATTYKFQTHSAASPTFDGNIGLFNWSTGVGGFGYHTNRSKSGTIGVHAAVVDGDVLGQWVARGSDGSAFFAATNITATVEGAVASGQVPGKLLFYTRPVGGPGIVQRLLIDNLGRVVAGPSATASLGGYLSLVGALTANATFSIEGYQNGTPGAAIALRHSRGPAVGQLTPLQVNDAIGTITFEGVDSVPSMTSNGAAITALVDSSPISGHIASRITFWTDNNTAFAERMRLTNGGTLQIFNGGATPPSAAGSLHVAALSGALATISVDNYQNAAGSAFLNLRHSRGGTLGAHGALQADDPIGTFQVVGSDGTGWVTCGSVQFMCHSAPTAGRVPTRISFNIDNGTGLAERIRIWPSGGMSLDPANADPGFGALAATNIKGTITNNDAAAGCVGEYLESVSQISNAITANTLTNLTSLSLTAGDWDLYLRVMHAVTGSVAHGVEIEISTISATFSGVLGNSYVSTAFGAVSTSSTLTERRLKLASTTTIFAVVRMSVGGNAGYQFFARRRR